ncbi:MAG: peptidase [Rhodobacterales bacterium]|nr:peptidase [Rhodobacterales bacterium]
MKQTFFGLALAAAVVTTGVAAPATGQAADGRAVLTTYADIAQALYGDSLAAARDLKAAVDRLVADPTEGNLARARAAWRAARVPYQQTEVYRFGNAVVDDWEGKVNAWPLDEGLIDYVDAGAYGTENDENAYFAANVIANATLRIGGQTIDATTIDKALIQSLHEVGDVEANVATGYHAVEFLLWGQDLNGTGPGAGARPATDFDAAHCTGGHCDRRAAYLVAVTDLLIDDLAWMAAQWDAQGPARQGLVGGDPQAGLTVVLTGMGSLSYGELAGERMKLGLMLHDPEEEHDCFSDNTVYSHYYDVVGMRNVLAGAYRRTDGRLVKGPGLTDVLGAEAGRRLTAAVDATIDRMRAMVDRNERVEAYDQMIGDGNAEGNAVVQAAIDALLVQTKAIEGAVRDLGLTAIAFEGSDSLDAPEKVQ